jgi:hypothetical protein
VGLQSVLNSVIESPWVLRVRRNHGLEHASIHVLTEKNARRSIAGHSDANGFWLFGKLSTDEVEEAVNEALGRLRAGERHLAVHPGCGTNLVTAGGLAGLAGAVAMRGADRRGWADRLPLAILFSTAALIVARPLGTRIQQRVTTTGDPGGLVVLNIRAGQRAGIPGHRVDTRS